MLKYILVFLRYYKDSVFYFDILIFSKSLFDSPAEKAARRGVLDNKVSADGLPPGAQPAVPFPRAIPAPYRATEKFRLISSSKSALNVFLFAPTARSRFAVFQTPMTQGKIRRFRRVMIETS